jgi:hypothetical protein
MPIPLIPIIAGTAARVAAGTAARAGAGTATRAVAGQAAKTATGQAAKTAAKGGTSLTGRTASGKTLQATKPRQQWDWSNMANNFTEE